MMKIALLPPSINNSLDIQNPELGNPGLGGTQYNFITLPYYFQKNFPEHVEWSFLCSKQLLIPDHINQLTYESQDELKELIIKNHFDFVIWRPVNDDPVFEIIKTSNTSFISWIHNVPNANTLRLLAILPNIRANVFVGHEALDLVRDHAIINKSTVIYNGFDPLPYFQIPDQTRDPNLVVYLGSLHSAKCFHLLAQAWPEILRKKPNAKLVVIGSGKLYDHESELGPYGLAEKNYEEQFITPLLDSDGEIMNSVHFAGLLGEEKIPIMKKAAIGVINPHGKSEICPGSAIEFQACETPVVAGGRYGNLDVIINNKTGLLVKSNRELVDSICELLADGPKRRRLGKSGKKFISEKFSQEATVTQWRSLLDNLINGSEMTIIPVKRNLLYNFKIVFELLRIIKFKLGLFKNFPSIYEIVERSKNNG